MLFPGIKKIGKQLGFQRTGNSVSGLIEETHVTLYDASNLKIADLRFPEVSAEFVVAVEPILKDAKIKHFEWLDDTLRVRFYEFFKPYPVQKIKEIITKISIINMEDFPNARFCCSACHENRDAETYYAGDDHYVLCPQCAERIGQEIKDQQASFKQQPGHYCLGALFAFFSTFPGIIVTALLFVFFSRLAAVSTVLYIFLAIWGYKKGKGKTDIIGVAILVSVGIVMTAVGIVVSYGINVLYLTKNVERAIAVMKEISVQRELVVNIALGLFLSILYLAFQSWEMAKEWKVQLLKRSREIA